MDISPASVRHETEAPGGGSQSSDSKQIKQRVIRTYMMDLWSFIPYYMGHLCAALKKESVEVRLGSSRYHLDRDYFRKLGLQPDLLLLDWGGGIKSVGLRRLVKSIEYLANLSFLATRLGLSRPDVVHVQYFPFLERGFRFELWFMRWIRLLGIPLVYTVHNVLPQDSGDRHKRLYKSVYSRADVFICHGNEASSQLIQEFSVPKEKIRIIPHGPLYAAKPDLTPKQAKERLGLAADETLVVCVGVISKYKGIPFLLETWKMALENGGRGRLLIAGTGDAGSLAKIRKTILTNKLEASVEFWPRFLSVAELPLIHQAADILVYPYQAGTTSGALLTGINYQKPIIATTLPFFREHLRSGQDSLLVDYGDVTEWARCLCELLGDEGRRKQMGRLIESSKTGDSNWNEIARATSECYRIARGDSILRK